MKDPVLFIAGDVEISGDVTAVRLVTPMSRYDFVTIEVGPDDMLEVRVIPVSDLQDFDGVLFQADSGPEENTVVLRQVEVTFWPFNDAEEEADDAEDDEEQEQEELEEGDDDDDDDDGADGPGIGGATPFRIVNEAWWEEFMRRHNRG